MRWLNVKAASPLHLSWTSLHCHQSPRTSLHFLLCNIVFVFIFLLVFVFVSLTYQYLILPICLSWQYKMRKFAHYCCQARLFEKITRTSTFDNHPTTKFISSGHISTRILKMATGNSDKSLRWGGGEKERRRTHSLRKVNTW